MGQLKTFEHSIRPLLTPIGVHKDIIGPYEDLTVPFRIEPVLRSQACRIQMFTTLDERHTPCAPSSPSVFFEVYRAIFEIHFRWLSINGLISCCVRPVQVSASPMQASPSVKETIGMHLNEKAWGDNWEGEQLLALGDRNHSNSWHNQYELAVQFCHMEIGIDISFSGGSLFRVYNICWINLVNIYHADSPSENVSYFFIIVWRSIRRAWYFSQLPMFFRRIQYPWSTQSIASLKVTFWKSCLKSEVSEYKNRWRFKQHASSFGVQRSQANN